MRICSYEEAHHGSNFFVKQFCTINVAHPPKFVINLNLIITFKPKYTCINFHILFSVVGCLASGTLHFLILTRIVFVNAFTWVEIWYDYCDLRGFESQAQAKMNLTNLDLSQAQDA